MRATTPVAGIGVQFRQVPGGTQISANQTDDFGATVKSYFIRNGVLVRAKIVIRGDVETIG